MKKVIETDKEKKQTEQKYMQHQMLTEYLKAIQQQLQQLEMQTAELEATNAALGEFSNIKTESEILIPLAGGIFAKAILKDNSELIVNIGGKASVCKPVADVQKMLSEQMNEIRMAQSQLTTQMEQMAAQASSLEEELGGQ